MPDLLSKNIKYVKGVGPAKAGLLAKINIYTVRDLLEHYPRCYEDRSNLKLIRALTDGELQTFQATIISIDESRPRKGLTVTKITVRDQSGIAQLVWFNQAYLKNRFRLGMEIIICGKVERRFTTLQIANPEVEILDGSDTLHTGRIVPIYSSVENLNQRFLRGLIYQVISSGSVISETLPDDLIGQYNLMRRTDALTNIHFPKSVEELAQARRRLVFEELFLLQSGLAFLRQKNKQSTRGVKHAPDGQLLRQAHECLPFQLTEDQQKVLQEINTDMEDVSPMQRLLQGDVGSGKTVIAALALVKTVENGYQGALMAPTEILAEQHYHTLAQLLSPLGVRLAILTGKMSKRSRQELLEQMHDGAIDIVIGTHALIQEDVEFKHLGLVVTDEQHRFGVQQRANLQAKGIAPDVLVMTATPIPRTMALTVYGDLDVSVIRQLPPGRKVVKTYVANTGMRQRVYNFVTREVENGRQAYVVCPLVEESEKLEAQSAVQLYEELSISHFKNIACGLIHGRMKSSEKDKIMAAFYSNDINVLIATTVIEVGVNVPNATVMIIEGAERFGLAQLHQLRGRIGRGEHQSYCILLSDSKSDDSKERLDIMTKSNDGFVLAEKDLLIRGPGQFFGTRQHGLPDLKIANIVTDIDILLEARRAVHTVFSRSDRPIFLLNILSERFGEEFKMILQS